MLQKYIVAAKHTTFHDYLYHHKLARTYCQHINKLEHTIGIKNQEIIILPDYTNLKDNIEIIQYLKQNNNKLTYLTGRF